MLIFDGKLAKKIPNLGDQPIIIFTKKTPKIFPIWQMFVPLRVHFRRIFPTIDYYWRTFGK